MEGGRAWREQPSGACHQRTERSVQGACVHATQMMLMLVHRLQPYGPTCLNPGAHVPLCPLGLSYAPPARGPVTSSRDGPAAAAPAAAAATLVVAPPAPAAAPAPTPLPAQLNTLLSMEEEEMSSDQLQCKDALKSGASGPMGREPVMLGAVVPYHQFNGRSTAAE